MQTLQINPRSGAVHSPQPKWRESSPKQKYTDMCGCLKTWASGRTVLHKTRSQCQAKKNAAFTVMGLRPEPLPNYCSVSVGLLRQAGHAAKPNKWSAFRVGWRRMRLAI